MSPLLSARKSLSCLNWKRETMPMYYRKSSVDDYKIVLIGEIQLQVITKSG